MIEVVFYVLKLLGDLGLPEIDNYFDGSIVAVIRDPEMYVQDIQFNFKL